MPWFDRKWPALLLYPFSLLYSAVVRFRNTLYDLGFLKSRSVGCAVISIGNITVGGSGKTPVTQWLVNELRARGVKAVILSRGYKRKSRGTVLAADEEGPLAGAEETGDEPLMLALNCPGTPVLVDADRLRGAQAAARFCPDVIVLDDGFQHRRMARDLDIVTFRNRLPLGNGFCLPAGPLREPPSGLKRADLLLFTGDGSLPQDFHSYGKHAFAAAYRLYDAVNAAGQSIDTFRLEGKKTVVFCGVANPMSFYRLLQNAGVSITDFNAFPDHHFYTDCELESLKKKAERLGAELILTTEKDWVKLPSELLDPRWARVRLALQMDEMSKVSIIEKCLSLLSQHHTKSACKRE